MMSLRRNAFGLRRALGALGAVLTSPPAVGAAYVLGLAAWAGQRGSDDDADLGDVRRAEAVATFIERRFSTEIGRMKIGIVAAAIALGLLVGLVGHLLVRVRGTRAGFARPALVRRLLESAGVVAALHAAFVLWAMADSPQLYAARWYAKGGAARTVQVLATDLLGPRGVVLVTVLGAVAFVRPARIGYLARRALAVVRRPARRWLGTIAARASSIVLLVAGVAVATFAGEPRIGSARAAEALDVNVVNADNAVNAGAPRDAARPNVLILAADSLRADRLDARVAPTLASLAARATTFERAYVSLPRTFPSWVTILTGRHGHHHGIRSMFPTWEERAKDFDALPQRFARAGWSTAVVSDYAGDIFSRIDLGFGRVETPSFDFRQLIRQRALERETPLLPALHSHVGRRLFPVMRELNDAADPMLLADDVTSAMRAMRSVPFFLTVFFSAAHFPYAAPAPYYAKYTDPSYRGRFKYHKPVGLGQEAAPDADDVRQIRALYDGAVSAIDDAVARVLDSLNRLGLADRTIIVVTADHGETLYDNGHGQGHGDHLFGDEGTHVPLVIYDPRSSGKGGGRRERHVVRDVDLAPTLYELAGIAPAPALDGRSLAPAVRGEPIDTRFAYAESELWFTEDIPALPADMRIPYPGIMGLTELDSRHNAEIVMRKDMAATTLMARHRMVRDERYKLVYVPTRAAVKYLLFDTFVDPGEMKDIAAARPDIVASLRAELWRFMLEDPLMQQKDGWLVPRDTAFARGPTP